MPLTVHTSRAEVFPVPDTPLLKHCCAQCLKHIFVDASDDAKRKFTVIQTWHKTVYVSADLLGDLNLRYMDYRDHKC